MVHAQITIIVILSLVYVCNASTLGLYNRNEKILSRSNSPGVQHWIYPNSRSGNGFNLNQFGLGIFNTLLGQGNPFAEPEPDSNPTQSGDSRIVDGVINALGRKYACSFFKYSMDYTDLPFILPSHSWTRSISDFSC